MCTSFNQQAQSLLAKLANQCQRDGSFGSMSSSIYDTSWLSMVRRPMQAGELYEHDEAAQWLFPECFDFILKSQLPSGAWGSYASQVDGILNTSAALLALRKHMRADPGNSDWAERSRTAGLALTELLDDLDISAVDQVGFEILIIQHLELLADEGVCVNAPNLDVLKQIRLEKLSKIPLGSLHKIRSTLHHSLEAFVGSEVDFNGLSRWLEPNGSMMGSPSSTAAYLMNTSSWDESAEAYLRNVVYNGPGQGDGSVPCAWPTSTFELSWVVATLISAGIQVEESSSSPIVHFLQQTLRAPGSLPDADDTAKVIISLYGLGQQPSVDGLLSAFESENHFMTYPRERNPSLTANCHVLICLLKSKNAISHIAQICKAALFLTERVFVGEVQDKWNRSEFYWTMLLAEAYMLLYQRENIVSRLFHLSPKLQHDIPIVCLHLLKKVILQQDHHGAWGGCETTSYAIMTLSALSSLSVIRQLRDTPVEDVFAQGKRFLLQNRNDWPRGQHIWVEKVNYASDTLSEAYCLAAALVEIPSDAVDGSHLHTTSLYQIHENLRERMKKVGCLVSQTLPGRKLSRPVREISELQACYYLLSTQHHHKTIFPENGKGDRNYQLIIALAFTVCAATCSGYHITLSLLREMMLLSDLNFLVDEYMERLTDGGTTPDTQAIAHLINHVFEKETRPAILTEVEDNVDLQRTSRLIGMADQLTNVVKYVLRHQAVLKSPRYYQQWLAYELKTFLLAHVAQAADNYRFASQVDVVSGNGANQKPLEYKDAGQTFFHWVHNTSADHTSCPFSFVFFNALLYSSSSSSHSPFPSVHLNRTDIFGSARTKYLAADLCRHLATLCRLENDYGSLRRDLEECNLNSLNFPEFAPVCEIATRDLRGEQTMKSELTWLAQYERRGLEIALAALLEESAVECRELLEGGLGFFINVTCLFGQIYILKDVGIRIK
ncbi:hypothetical protein F4825DRAFT_469094 [Nemania diffusa]|nr:hypothetical protein F4825DRAFT_469094 [Nemania diffusa]